MVRSAQGQTVRQEKSRRTSRIHRFTITGGAVLPPCSPNLGFVSRLFADAIWLRPRSAQSLHKGLMKAFYGNDAYRIHCSDCYPALLAEVPGVSAVSPQISPEWIILKRS